MAPVRRPTSPGAAIRRGLGAALAGSALAAVVPSVLVGAPLGSDPTAALRLAAQDDAAHDDATHDDATQNDATQNDAARDAAVPQTDPSGGVPTLGRPSAVPPATAASTEPTGVPLIATLSPIAATPEPDLPGIANVEDLIKAADLAEAARKAADVQRCSVPLPQLGRVKPWVRDAAGFLACQYEDHHLLGVGGRGGRTSDHPRGLAVDVMARGGDGDRIASCVLDNREELGVTYVIWKQRINYGDGWQPMEDRGSITENHFDHVHVSFATHAPTGTPDPSRCR